MFLKTGDLEKAKKHFYKKYMYFELDGVFLLEIGYIGLDLIDLESFSTHEEIRNEIDNDPYGTLFTD